jgi:hypothetical protein
MSDASSPRWHLDENCQKFDVVNHDLSASLNKLVQFGELFVEVSLIQPALDDTPPLDGPRLTPLHVRR